MSPQAPGGRAQPQGAESAAQQGEAERSQRREGERSSTGRFPLPDVAWPPLRGFWEAAARGVLAIPRCAGCSAWNWYPRTACRSCGGTEMPWTPTAGRATLYSFAVVRRALFEPFAALVPYATGLVALEEDASVRLVTRFVDCDPEALRIGQPVRAVFRPLELAGTPGSIPAPFFAPIENPNPSRTP